MVDRTERFHDGVALETGRQVTDQHFAVAIDDHAGTVRDGWIRRGAGVDAGAGGQGRLLGGLKRDVGSLLGDLDRRRRRIDVEPCCQAADERARADRAAGQRRRQDVLDRIGNAGGGFGQL